MANANHAPIIAPNVKNQQANAPNAAEVIIFLIINALEAVVMGTLALITYARNAPTTAKHAKIQPANAHRAMEATSSLTINAFQIVAVDM